MKALLIGLAAFLFLTSLAAVEAQEVDVINGQVLEEGTGVPLPGAAAPYVSVQLQWRPYLTSSYIWLVGSVCWPAEGQPQVGCADSAGLFTFTASADKKALPAGYYLMDVYANAFLLKRIEFYFDGVSAFQSVFLARSPVLLGVFIPFVPEEGLWELEYTLYNQAGAPLFLEVISSVTLPGSTSQSIFKQVKKIVAVTSDVKTVTESIEIPGEVPNGLYVCVTAQVTQAGNADVTDVFASTYFCGVKGIFLTETPKG